MIVIEERKTVIEVGMSRIVLDIHKSHFNTTCDLLMEILPQKKMLGIKILRHIYPIGLRQAKDIVDFLSEHG